MSNWSNNPSQYDPWADIQAARETIRNQHYENHPLILSEQGYQMYLDCIERLKRRTFNIDKKWAYRRRMRRIKKWPKKSRKRRQ